MLHRLIALGLVTAILALAPAAHASPPDQSWLPGLYDNADFDDVILLITSTLPGIQPSIGSSLQPVDSVVNLLSLANSAAPVPSPSSSGPSRAPPLA